MKIELWYLGKKGKNPYRDAIDDFVKRVNFYHSYEIKNFDNSKWTRLNDTQRIRAEEAAFLRGKMDKQDFVICLDEHGERFTSEKFADKLNHWMNRGPGRILFIVGGSFGIDETLLKRSQCNMRLSDMTFPHQMVQLIFSEQLYRAFNILSGAGYHHS